MVPPRLIVRRGGREMANMRKLGRCANATFALAFAVLGCARLDVARRVPEPAAPAPEIAGEDLDGVPFRLSDYRGKVVLLDFWGDW
jgi:hypothetical protein